MAAAGAPAPAAAVFLKEKTGRPRFPDRNRDQAGTMAAGSRWGLLQLIGPCGPWPSPAWGNAPPTRSRTAWRPAGRTADTGSEFMRRRAREMGSCFRQSTDATLLQTAHQVLAGRFVDL